jgi:hypothetical protein
MQKKIIFREVDELYLQNNPPKSRYDVVQQGTGRNAKRESMLYDNTGKIRWNVDKKQR